MDRIIDFLIDAKKVTYAGKGAESKSSRPSSHDLEYQDGNLRYLDTYLGGASFAGEEAVWEDSIPIWSMNYCGRVLEEEFEGDFLKEALSNVPKDMPYRGPRYYRNGSFEYKCIVEGDFGWFTGHEDIYKDNKKVYECNFHGGTIR